MDRGKLEIEEHNAEWDLHVKQWTYFIYRDSFKTKELAIEAAEPWLAKGVDCKIELTVEREWSD